MTSAAAPAELSVREGYAAPANLPSGTCELTTLLTPDDGAVVRVDHADPRILIAAELVERVARGDLRPEAAFDLSPLNYTVPNGHAGAFFKIRAVNRTVIYRLTEYVAPVHGYIAEWPD